jgi:hypothetical protein
VGGERRADTKEKELPCFWDLARAAGLLPPATASSSRGGVDGDLGAEERWQPPRRGRPWLFDLRAQGLVVLERLRPARPKREAAAGPSATMRREKREGGSRSPGTAGEEEALASPAPPAESMTL